MTHHRQPLTAPDAPAAVGPYVHAVRSGGLLFCSGQIPLDPDSGELVTGSVGDQARQCLENLTAVCRAAGASLGDAVRITVYVVDQSSAAEVNEVYASFFESQSEPPARAMVGVAWLPKAARVEMDAVVALPD